MCIVYIYVYINIEHCAYSKKKKSLDPWERAKFSQEGREQRKVVAAKASDMTQSVRRRTSGHRAESGGAPDLHSSPPYSVRCWRLR